MKTRRCFILCTVIETIVSVLWLVAGIELLILYAANSLDVLSKGFCYFNWVSLFNFLLPIAPVCLLLEVCFIRRKRNKRLPL